MRDDRCQLRIFNRKLNDLIKMKMTNSTREYDSSAPTHKNSEEHVSGKVVVKLSKAFEFRA
jgi:hypothetical protein